MKKTPDKIIKRKRKEKPRVTGKQREKIRTADAAPKQIVKVRRITVTDVMRATAKNQQEILLESAQREEQQGISLAVTEFYERAVDKTKAQEMLARAAEQNKPPATAQAPTPAPANEELAVAADPDEAENGGPPPIGLVHDEERWFVEGATGDTAHLDDLAKTRSFYIDRSDKGKVWFIRGSITIAVAAVVVVVAAAIKDACPTNSSPSSQSDKKPAETASPSQSESQKSPEQKLDFDINCEFNFVPPNAIGKPYCKGLKNGTGYSLVFDKAASAGQDGIVRGSILIDENQDGTEDYSCGVSLLRPKDTTEAQKLEQLPKTSPLKCLPIAPVEPEG